VGSAHQARRRPAGHHPPGNPGDVCSQEHRALALRVAQEGIILLKNEDNVLPWTRPGAHDRPDRTQCDVARLDGTAAVS